MSNEQTYYQPQARIVQGKEDIWILSERQPYPGATEVDPTRPYEGVRIGYHRIVDREGMYMSQWSPEDIQGREMVLVPVERLHAVDAALDDLGNRLMKLKNNPSVNDFAAVGLLSMIASLEATRQLLLGNAAMEGGDAK